MKTITTLTYVRLARSWAAVGRSHIEAGNVNEARHSYRLAAHYAVTVYELAAEAMAVEMAA